MTINYLNGMVLEALLLSRGGDTLSAAVQGEDDARIFTLNGGGWVSAEGDPVRIRFAWEHRDQAPVPTEGDCVCSKELASRLITMLLVGSEGNDLIENLLYVFSGESQRVQLRRSELNLAPVPAELVQGGAMASLLLN